ncbi:MAG: hypothetical protein OJI67_14145 [Prosthecobacter sp.]|nr:hypothetical protein [Prosthecobacter sp.]
MSSTLIEVEKQCFEFGEPWYVAFKYDETAYYRKKAMKLQGIVEGVPQSAKAVDVIGVHELTGLLLLEAKDFRGHRIANKPRMGHEVAVEIAVKVRDTIAALVGALRNNVQEFPSEVLAAAFQKGNDVTVVLWLEDDSFRNTDSAKQKLGALTGVLKSKLAWLNVKAFVLSSSVVNRLPDLVVTNRPGAGVTNP